MECVLRVSGENFQIDKFLEMETLQLAKVWRKGEASLPARPTLQNNSDSGFNVVVSNKPYTAIENQVIDAIAFLHVHYSIIEELRNYGADNIILDFGEAWPDHVAHFDRFPAELVSIAGRLGIALKVSHYLTSNEPSGPI